MLTKEQEKWIAHLDNKKIIEIFLYNPESKKVFEEIKKEINSFLPELEVLHCGSTALEILGEKEIDIYVPVLEKDFDKYFEKMEKHFGAPGSFYAKERARFVRPTKNIKITVFLINKETENWKNHGKFENYLKQNHSALQEYVKLKEESNGLNAQQYYRKKLEFINKILDLVN